MISVMPNEFRIISLITRAFFEKNCLHWLIILMLFFVPATLALAFFCAEVYGFYDITFAYVRVIILGIGGGLFENNRHFFELENQISVQDGNRSGKWELFVLEFACQTLSLLIFAIFSATVVEIIHKARKVEEVLANESLQHELSYIDQWIKSKK